MKLSKGCSGFSHIWNILKKPRFSLLFLKRRDMARLGVDPEDHEPILVVSWRKLQVCVCSLSGTEGEKARV